MLSFAGATAHFPNRWSMVKTMMAADDNDSFGKLKFDGQRKLGCVSGDLKKEALIRLTQTLI